MIFTIMTITPQGIKAWLDRGRLTNTFSHDLTVCPLQSGKFFFGDTRWNDV